MRKARFTEYQITAVLKPVKVGRTVKDVCSETGISEPAAITKRNKYAGMSV
ncbi:transposase [Morganella morganii]